MAVFETLGSTKTKIRQGLDLSAIRTPRNGTTLHISPTLETESPLAHHYKRVKSLQKRLFGIALALLYPPEVTCMDRGVLVKHLRPALLLLAVALFSASAWADGIDPRAHSSEGYWRHPNYRAIPNLFPKQGEPALIASVAIFNDNGTYRLALTQSDVAWISFSRIRLARRSPARLDDRIRRPGLVFNCPSNGGFVRCLFFLRPSDVGRVTDITFSDGIGILTAVHRVWPPQRCLP